MAQRAHARHAGAEGAGLGADLGEEVGEIVHAHLGVGHPDRRHCHQVGNRGELGAQALGAGVEQGVDGHGADGGHAHGVAIGRGLGHGFGAYQPARAAAVVDHHRLAQRAAHALGQHPRDDIGGAAGCKRHDQLDGLAWIVVGGLRAQRQRDAQRGEAEGAHASQRQALYGAGQGAHGTFLWMGETLRWATTCTTGSQVMQARHGTIEKIGRLGLTESRACHKQCRWVACRIWAENGSQTRFHGPVP